MKLNLYTSGEDWYHTYRIPSLIAARNGDLLAICEGRRHTARDHGDIDLLIKRSADGGESWSEQGVIYGEPGDVTIGNPCPVLDRDTGVIWLPFCRDNRDVLMTRSEDDGKTWSPPVDISQSASRPDWDWYATGPGVGIQMRDHRFSGRLVIPCDHRNDNEYRNGSHALLSDDHGETWRVSELMTPGPNECQVVELAGGRLMMNIRMQSHREGYRGVSLSKDGGESWTDVRHEQQLPCPRYQAGFVTDGKVLLFTNPVPPSGPAVEKGDRLNLIARISTDDGDTWSNTADLHPGPAAYSSPLILNDQEAACFYEAGDSHFREHLVFHRFPLR